MIKNGKYYEEKGYTETYDDEDLWSMLRYCGLIQCVPEELDHRTLHRFDAFVRDMMHFDFEKERELTLEYIKRIEPDELRQKVELMDWEKTLREREADVIKYSPMIVSECGSKIPRLIQLARVYVLYCENEAREWDKLSIEERI